MVEAASLSFLKLNIQREHKTKQNKTKKGGMERGNINDGMERLLLNK